MLRAYIEGKYAQKEAEHEKIQEEKAAEFAAMLCWANAEEAIQEAEANAAAAQDKRRTRPRRKTPPAGEAGGGKC